MPRARTTTLSVLAVTACLLLATPACSGDDDARPKKSTTSSTATTAAPTTGGGGAATTAPVTGAPATAPSTAPVADEPLPPVGKGRSVEFGGGVEVQMTKVESLRAEGRGPGQTTGPAVAVTLTVRNGSDRPIDLSRIAVTASTPDGTPAIDSNGDPASPFVGVVPPGGEGTAVYLFRVNEGSPPLVVEVQSADFARVPRFTTG